MDQLGVITCGADTPFGFAQGRFLRTECARIGHPSIYWFKDRVLLRMYVSRPPLLLSIESKIKHVKDNCRIDNEHKQSELGHPPDEVGCLEWDVDAAGDGCHPLRPRQGIPEPKRFHEAQNRINTDRKSTRLNSSHLG